MKVFSKVIVALTTLLSLQVNGQSDEGYWLLEQRTPSWARHVFNDSKMSDSLRLSDFLNPFYFEEDFNGDSKRDIAILVNNKKTDTKGILIIHGATHETFLLGAGNMFDNHVDDFFWMDVWKISRESKIHQLTYKENLDIDGSIEITIHNPNLEIIKTESSSGHIYWNGRTYVHAQTSE